LISLLSDLASQKDFPCSRFIACFRTGNSDQINKLHSHLPDKHETKKNFEDGAIEDEL